MPAVAADFLKELRVDEIMQELEDVRRLPGQLLFLGRLKSVPADNRQLIAKSESRVQIAPMIATNAKAPVFQSQRFHLETNTLGKIKLGTHMDEDTMEEWLDILNAPIRDPQGILAGGIIRKMVADQQLAIMQQKEWLAVAMALDGKVGSASYSRLGFVLEGVSWGRYDDLKITVAIPWEGNALTAAPINDIWNARQLREERYGMMTNRITMPTQALRTIIGTKDFQDKIKNFLPSFVDYTKFFPGNTPYQRNAVAQLLDMEVVLYDGRYRNQAEDGSWVSGRFLPMTPTCPIILDDKNDDNQDSVQDFGMGMPMEARMSELVGAGATEGQVISGPSAGGSQRAVSYATMKDDMDPVGLTVFSVAKCFPRLYNRASNAVLYVGPMTDLIPVTDLSPV